MCRSKVSHHNSKRANPITVATWAKLPLTSKTRLQAFPFHPFDSQTHPTTTSLIHVFAIAEIHHHQPRTSAIFRDSVRPFSPPDIIKRAHHRCQEGVSCKPPSPLRVSSSSPHGADACSRILNLRSDMLAGRRRVC